MAAGTLAASLVWCGLFLGGKVISPQQAAAEAKPPPRSLVTAQLERRSLKEEIVARGAPTKAAGLRVGPAPGLIGPDSVVTGVHIGPGDVIRDGQLLIEVSGSPVVAAILPFRLYRDISIGDRGPDVRELSRYLNRLGYVSAVGDVATASLRDSAVKFFKDRGYPDLFGVDGKTEPTVVVRQRWIIRIDRTGHEVDKVAVKVGSELGDPQVTLFECDVAPPSVLARVDDDAADRLRPGDEAMVADETGNRVIQGEVVAVENKQQDADARGRAVRIRPAKGQSFTDLPPDVRVTLIAAVAPNPVLVAPTTAIFTDEARISSIVSVDESGMPGKKVEIRLGSCVAGWCQIESSDIDLEAGMAVVVGENVSDE